MAYSICHQQTCSNMENAGFMVLTLVGWCTMDFRHENNYRFVGFDFMGSGG